jgi:hypothetical protein
MSTMETAYRIAAGAVRQRLAEQHPERLDRLASLRREDVAVFKGTYDHVEKVLHRLEIPFTLDPGEQVRKAKVVFVNCSVTYPPRLVKQMAALVESGALLVTSDWGLGRLVQQAFPNRVRWAGRGTGDEVVSVEPNLNSLWSEVVVLGADPQWWLESGSHPIQVVDPAKVRVEAASHDLLARYDAPVGAVSFDWGQGHLFHVISHFWHRRSRTPTERYRGPGADYLKAGMRLNENGISKVLREAREAPDAVNFGMLQSAATATELVAQLCIHAAEG